MDTNIKLIPSNVECLAFQQRGVLVNTDTDAYEDFIRRRNIMQSRDNDVKALEDKINNLEQQLAVVIQLLQNNLKDK